MHFATTDFNVEGLELLAELGVPVVDKSVRIKLEERINSRHHERGKTRA